MPPKQISPAKHWTFTYFGYSDPEIQNIINHPKIQNYVFQEETCPDTGNDHLQGYIEFKVKLRPKNLFPKEIHWEKRKGTRLQAARYCQKDETRKAGGRKWSSFGDIPEWLMRPLETIAGRLLPWQEELEGLLLEEPDDRTVHWYWCAEGGSGKSQFVKYMCRKYEWVCGLASFRSADIQTAVNEDYGAYLFDFSRTLDGHYPLGAIENIKNGRVTEAKLKKKMVTHDFNSPHIVCFANTPPEKWKLSQARWHVVCLDGLGPLLNDQPL